MANEYTIKNNPIMHKKGFMEYILFIEWSENNKKYAIQYTSEDWHKYKAWEKIIDNPIKHVKIYKLSQSTTRVPEYIKIALISIERYRVWQRIIPNQKGQFFYEDEDGDDALNLKRIEKRIILSALELSDWKQNNAAKKLGISPRALNYKISQYDDIKHSMWKRNGL